MKTQGVSIELTAWVWKNLPIFVEGGAPEKDRQLDYKVSCEQGTVSNVDPTSHIVDPLSDSQYYC